MARSDFARLLLGIGFFFQTTISSGALPAPDTRLKIFDTLASEIERLDGEALQVRLNRPTPWPEVIENLRSEITASEEPADFARALLLLDRAYPNLHSYAVPGLELQEAFGPSLEPAIRFSAEWLSETKTRFRISSIDLGLPITAADYPVFGDELIKINGQPMSYWSDRNLDFCDFPLQAQCDMDLHSGFIGRILPKSQNQTLTYTLKRKQRVWTIEVPIREARSLAIEGNVDPDPLLCRNQLDRYLGFSPSYIGNRLCVFESSDLPNTAIMRITSFSYRENPPEETIRSVQEEVDALYPWWLTHANWEHLVVDVINNGGGNSPVPYYQIIFQKPFQEQYFRLKKFPELLNERIRKGIFWDSPGQEIWFQDILRSGVFQNTAFGSLLPAVPMFCADESSNCTRGLFQTRPHPFQGNVSVLVNQWCVSSCDEFVYAMKEQLPNRARFYGQPQAADTAYGRLAIHVFLDQTQPQGFEIKLRPIQTKLDPLPFFTQIVSVTRSVNSEGTVVSGIPVPLDGFVPEPLENRSHWVQDALSAALNR